MHGMRAAWGGASAAVAVQAVTCALCDGLCDLAAAMTAAAAMTRVQHPTRGAERSALRAAYTKPAQIAEPVEAPAYTKPARLRRQAASASRPSGRGLSLRSASSPAPGTRPAPGRRSCCVHLEDGRLVRAPFRVSRRGYLLSGGRSLMRDGWTGGRSLPG